MAAIPRNNTLRVSVWSLPLVFAAGLVALPGHPLPAQIPGETSVLQPVQGALPYRRTWP
jgi:hypothetical protein